MVNFAVEGSTLMVQFSPAEILSAQRRTLRIPLTLVDSVSADPRPWETLSQIDDLEAPLARPDQIAQAARPWPPGSPPGPSGHELNKEVFSREFVRGRQWQREGGAVIGRAGPPGAQIFAHVSTGRPALRVDLSGTAPYMGFLVTHRDPEAAAADLRAAILGQFRQLADDQTRRLGPDHRDTLAARCREAIWLGRSGRAEEAAGQLRQLLDDQIRVLGGYDEDTVRTRALLAFGLATTGQAEESIRQLRQLADDQTRRLGPDHPQTLGVRSHLATGLAMTGRTEEAISELRRLIDDQIRVLGPGDPATRITMDNLARMEEPAKKRMTAW